VCACVCVGVCTFCCYDFHQSVSSMLIDNKCVFALCKYSSGKGLVTNVNNKKEKKERFNEVLFILSVFLVFIWLFKTVSL